MKLPNIKHLSLNEVVDFLVNMPRPLQIAVFLIVCLFAVLFGYMSMWALTVLNLIYL